MRFSTAAGLLSALLVPASALSIFNGNAPDVLTDDKLKIPGESPLELCAGDHDNDLIIIKNVDLTPNPPEAGTKLQIKATGEVKETIEEGAYVKLVVKYGLIRLLSTTADLCEQIGNVDLKCPVEPGTMEITKDVDLPSAIPPGKYTVFADVYTADDIPITCLTATVAFTRGALLEDEL